LFTDHLRKHAAYAGAHLVADRSHVHPGRTSGPACSRTTAANRSAPAVERQLRDPELLLHLGAGEFLPHRRLQDLLLLRRGVAASTLASHEVPPGRLLHLPRAAPDA